MDVTRILVVEDDDAARYIFATMLEHAGYAVREARDVAGAMAQLERAVPAAVLVDLGLPEVDGIELIRRVRATPGLEALPVVVVTVHACGSERETAFAAGCDRFLIKPVPPALLIRTLNELLAVPSAAPAVAPPAAG